MVTKATIKKSQQLGMNFSKACHRLRKTLMLKLLQQLGKNICHRCGELIETPEELSVDHMVDWLDRDPKLFWDTENVAYSHRRCNKAGRKPRSIRDKSPEGMSWCSKCKAFISTAQFSKDVTKYNGIRTVCSRHATEAMQKRRQRLKNSPVI